MKKAIHLQPNSQSLNSAGQVVAENDGYLFIDTICQASALMGVWHITGRIKVAPKSECLQFTGEQECIDSLFEMSFGQPYVEQVEIPDPEYTPETPL
jgi:hypothetical protein